MAVTTLGRQLVKQALPVKYRSFVDEPLTKDRQTKLTTKLAQEDPDGYIDILQNLNSIAQRVISVYGKDTTITLDDVDAGAPLKNMSQKLKELITATINRKDLTQQQKQEKVLQLGYKYTSKMRQLGLKDAHDRKTGLANQIDSGSRGNAVQLMQLIVGDMMMKDAMNRDIPYLAMMPYVQGDSPMSYWASAMSSRKSVYDVQAATGRVGYLSKQATNTTHSTPISMQDCGTSDTGIPVKATDPQNVGSLLLYPWKGHPAGSPVTEQMISQADQGQEFIVRSPTTCKAHNGVCSRCAGIQQDGKFPAIGSYVALNAVKSFIEPLTQCLHPDTKVRMADWSVKAIKDIKVGDMVLGCDKQGNARPVQVLNVYHNGLKTMYKTSFRAVGRSKQIRSLISTLDHKAMMIYYDHEKNFQSQQIKIGTQAKYRYFALPNNIQVHQGSVHQDMAFLLGFLCGDGCYSPGVKGQVHFSCADPTLIKYLQQYTAKFGMYVHLCAGQRIYYSIGKIKRSSQQSPIKKALIKYGMMGKYAWQKVMPNNFRDWDAWSIREFISGLVTADGHIGIHTKSGGGGFRFNIASTSYQLLQQVVECLGKYAAIIIPHISGSESGHKKKLHLIQSSDVQVVERFLNYVQPQGIKVQTKAHVLDEISKWKQANPQPVPRYAAKIISQQYFGQVQSIDIEVDHPDHLFLLETFVSVSNSGISSKHGSGVGGVKNIDPDGQDQPTGFQSIQRMLLAPRNFPGGAVLAPQDGRVTEVRQAPQGGHFITVAGKTTYAPVARTVTVKVGDVVEAGDTITNGVPNPMQVVKYKGIGQGRHYFTEKLFQLLPKTGAGTKRRNLQQFSRAMINKVRITSDDGYGGYYPGDLVDYDEIADKWQPRDDSKETDIKDSIGRYLEYPALYYSIGTKITPKVAQKMEKYGISKIVTHQDPPPFQPQFVPSKSFVLQDPHWMPRLMGERLQQGLFDAARKGLTDPYDSPSFVDKLIVGPYDPAKK